MTKYLVHQDIVGEMVRDGPMEVFLPMVIEDMTICAQNAGLSTTSLAWSVDYEPPWTWRGVQLGDRYRVNAVGHADV